MMSKHTQRDSPFIHWQSEKNLMDKNGVLIEPHQRIRITEKDGAVWEANTVFEDGVLTVSTLNVEQIKNAETWGQEHDWIKSRSWGCKVGYGEFGSWNCPRAPLTRIVPMWNEYDDVRPLSEKFGYNYRILNCEIVGDYKGNYPSLNKKYVSAAPDLLDALERVEDAVTSGRREIDIYAIRAVIAKARG